MQRKLTFLAFFLFSTDCFSQQYPFVYYTPRDGLVNSRVRSIKQDSRGRMAFMTFRGLSIYDGVKFANYTKEDGLANDLVNDMIELGPDSFLVASNTTELNLLVNGMIGIYKTRDNFTPIVNRFFRSSDGRLFVAADEGLFQLSDKKFSRIPLLFQGNDIGFFLDRITEWKNFFLITVWNPERKQKLILYDRTRQKVLDVDSKDELVNCVKDASNQLWVSTPAGIRFIDTSSLRAGRIVFQLPPVPFQQPAQLNSYISIDLMNNIWLYGETGVTKITPLSQRQVFSVAQGLRSTNLTDICIDREGTAWFSSDGNGVFKIRNDNIELLSEPGRQHVISTLAVGNDTTWTLSENKIYMTHGAETRTFPLAKGSPLGNYVHVFEEKLYIGDSRKIVCVENKNSSFAYLHPKLIIDNSTGGMVLGNAVVDHNGVLIQYGKENDTVFKLVALRGGKMISLNPISYMVDQLVMDRQNRLWIATRSNHLMVFTTHPDRPDHYLELFKDFYSELPEMSPRCITLDTAGNVWIGTRYHGVFRLHFDGWRLSSTVQFNAQTGLTDNFIYAINCDAANTIWVGTQTGLDKIFWKNGRFITGNVSKSNNFFQSIHQIEFTKNNTVWALTGEGSIMKISPSFSRNTIQAPDFLLTSIQVNNRPFRDSTAVFTYQQNNLSIDAAALSFIDERSINYSYVLEGSGNNVWSKPSNNSSFNFINLPPARYTLKIKADFPEAIYPSQVIFFSFTIRPPWWETWWFKTLAGLFVVASLAFTLRFYYGRKLERQKMFLERKQAIEKERTRIATDMHDDLGAGLSRIKFLSETIGIKKQRQLPFEEDIVKIREYSHEMIDKMGEIVWALNEKNDSLSDLLSYTRSYTVEYLSQNGLACTVDFPDTLPAGFVSGEFRRNIFLAVKEILHNIVKHSQANQVNISIQVNEKIFINIQDDGIGFDRTRTRPFSNGLTNIEKRMADIGGFVNIRNQGGTLVSLAAPLP